MTDLRRMRVRFLRVLLAAVVAAALFGCGGAGGSEDPDEPTRHPDCPATAKVDEIWLEQLVCPAAFSGLANRSTSSLFANQSSVKFVIDLQDNNRTYFVNSAHYDLHYFFCRDHLEISGLDPVGTHAEFNQRQYRSADRRFILGTVSFYGDQQVVALEFATGDTIDADQILFAYEHVKERMYFGDQLIYRPISTDHERSARDELAGQIPIIFTEELYEGISYQPLNPGIAYGYLRMIGDGPVAGARPTDIVVLDDAPNDIRPVAGVITQQFQTPLSHVNILSKNRGTPNMGLADALSHPRLLPLADQLVRLQVNAQGWTISPASQREADAYWASIRPTETFVPPLDTTVEAIQDLSQIDGAALPFIGAKAANLAEMTKIPGVPLPESPMAIPFVHYLRHLERNGLDVVIEDLLDDERFETDLDWRQSELARLRQRIEDAPFDPVLRNQLHAALRARFAEDRRIRFRSSTNSEDLPSFNGAGLYHSYSGSLVDDPRMPDEAVRRVWASLWTDQAVAERDFYRIDHRAVAMAILVHPSFPDEEANGVALTVNIFNQRRPGFYINVQAGEASVTNPGPGEVPDQFILYTWYDEPETEYLSYSNLNGGEPVMTFEEIIELHDTLRAIHQHFRPIYDPAGRDPRYGMDVEFKLVAETRELVIKQARPLPR